ncbi:MAG: hypothetical protein R2843_15090 [Thermomicrobiales bacterium]
MGNERTDGELLDRFARQADEAAFRTLVVRYSGWCSRPSGSNDRPLTEDVGQRVFLALAKKAAAVARGAAPLPSWLHHTTLLEAKAVRRARSRHHRKRGAHERTGRSTTGGIRLAGRLPHLDAAIDSREADRDILLLHFVNELTFPEIKPARWFRCRLAKAVAPRLGIPARRSRSQGRRAFHRRAHRQS